VGTPSRGSGACGKSLIERTGPNTYRGIFSLVAIMGFFMIIHGYGTYRATGYLPVWTPPNGMAHLAILSGRR